MSEKSISDELIDDIVETVSTKDEKTNVGRVLTDIVLKYCEDVENLHKSGLFGRNKSITVTAGSKLTAVTEVVLKYLEKKNKKILARTPYTVILLAMFVEAWENLDDITKAYYMQEYPFLEDLYSKAKKIFEP